MKPELSVIIPCYNENDRFDEGFSHYSLYLSKQNYDWELIFVNDGSKDETYKLIKKVQEKSPQVTSISYKVNKGKGFAIKAGVEKAKGKYILFTDIDHSVSIDTIEEFMNYLKKGAPVVIGSRRVKGAKFLKRQSPLREFLGKGFSFFVRLSISWEILDTTCGFKAFENKIAKKLFGKITIYDWAFDAEVLFLCKKYQCAFECFVHCHPSGMQVPLRIFRMIFLYRKSGKPFCTRSTCGA